MFPSLLTVEKMPEMILPLMPLEMMLSGDDVCTGDDAGDDALHALCTGDVCSGDDVLPALPVLGVPHVLETPVPSNQCLS